MARTRKFGQSPPAQWIGRDLPAAVPLLGNLLTTTSRVMLSADTGLGKTMFGIALAFAIRLGTDFLHWAGQRPAQVLYIDGEMPRDLMKERINLACASFQVAPPEEGIWFLSGEDVDSMAPLDSPGGQNWLDSFIERLGKVEFIIFDNLMSLTFQSLKEEDGWLMLEPWVKGLTKRGIGQLWIHHVGHDKTRGYGSKLKEWGFDTVMVAEHVEPNGADVAFRLTFPKARRRKPNNRDDFAPVHVELREGMWSSNATVATKGGKRGALPNAAQIALEQLRAAISKEGALLPIGADFPHHTTGVTMSAWRERSYQAGISTGASEAARRTAFARAVEKLTADGYCGV